MRMLSEASLKSGGSLIVLAAVLGCGQVFAGGLPAGGHFVSGHGSIAKANQSLTVKQSSTTGIIDWKAFSVGKHQAVTFDNGHGATLNRVTGGNLSTIAGSLQGSGTLFLMNDAGVIVSGSGRVVTGGNFIASTGSLSNSAFDSGERRIGDARNAVINRGSITSGRETRLIGGSATNAGTIHAARVDVFASEGAAVNSGVIDATGSARRNARIMIIAANGKTKVDGDLVARNRDGSGGHIETSGTHVSIAGRVEAGKGGSWLVDPEDLTVTKSAATSIDKSLNKGTSVKLEASKSSTSGPGTESTGDGDIIIASALNWTGHATLTLDAYHSVTVNAGVNDKGNGGLTIVTDDGGSGGHLSFGTSDSITFASNSDTLKINGNSYMLVSSIQTLASEIGDNPSGFYALAKSYDASDDGTYSSAPIASFSGIFEGLGNGISNFNINSADAAVGLFAKITDKGIVADLNLVDVSVTSTISETAAVGALAATNNGTVRGVAVSGTVTASGDVAPNTNQLDGLNIGGLVGVNSGTVTSDRSSAAVSATMPTSDNGAGNIGGLVGYNAKKAKIEDSTASGEASSPAQIGQIGGLVGASDGAITNSSASGKVVGSTGQGTYGGLVGISSGSITLSHASGNVSDSGFFAFVAGLAGDNQGDITQSYATGNANGGDGSALVGGFVGLNESGAIVSQSYATGAATVGSVPGAISGSDTNDLLAGGFVGANGGTISNSYAKGAVTGGAGSAIGGFVGDNVLFGSAPLIEESYSTGKVTGTDTLLGAFAGDSNQGGIQDSYWDTSTSGVSTGVGNLKKKTGVAGKTTAQLEAGVPSGFSSSVWGSSSKINGGLPYLKALKDTY